MKERPILFSGPMVRAILGGRKSQTRRVMRPQPWPGDHGWDWSWGPSRDPMRTSRWADYVRPYGPIEFHCPYGQRGLIDNQGEFLRQADRLWVRETWTSGYSRGCWGTIFAADGAFIQGKREHEKGPHYNADDRPPRTVNRPSIFMPRWASRITLAITEVRVERLQDITEEDAQAEGVEPADGTYTADFALHGYVRSYRALWDSLNGKKHPWSENPWVWVITFRMLP